MKKKILAVDIGGTNLKYALISSNGTITRKDAVTTASYSYQSLLNQIIQIYGTYHDTVCGIGISAPGRIDPVTNIIYGGGSFPFLDGKQLGADLPVSVPVSIENDGKSAAVAELWLGELQQVKNGVVLVLGTGVGGGIVLDHELWRGSNSSAGEFSLMMHGYPQSDLSNMAGFTTSSVKMIENIAKQKALPNIHDGRAVFDLINSGDHEALTLFEDFIDRIVELINNIQAVLDVDKFVIGGGISEQESLINAIQTRYQQSRAANVLFGKTVQNVMVTAAKFRNDANLLGAAYTLLRKLNEEE